MSLTPFWSIVSWVKALMLIGTLLSDSSRRVAVTVISGISAMPTASAGAGAAAAAGGSSARAADMAVAAIKQHSHATPTRPGAWMGRDRSVQLSNDIIIHSDKLPLIRLP